MFEKSDSPPFKSKISDHHKRSCLFATVLSLQLLLLFSSRFIPVTQLLRLTTITTTTSANSHTPPPSCPLGKIYVYDLPTIFNTDLVATCDDLNPWNSRCAALSNYGFGLHASTEDLFDIVPSFLLPAWFATDQFAGELIYHRRILSHPCRTTDASAASAFYLPFYAGLAVGKYLWSPFNKNYTARDRDYHCELLLKWVRDQLPWQRSGGWDHFIMLGRITWDFRRTKDDDWGGSFLHMIGMENVTRLLIERNPWDELDVGVPYPTGFHPRTLSDIKQWQQHVLSRNRTALFSFAGAARATIKDDFRGLLLSQCLKDNRCKSVDCSHSRCANKTGQTLSLFLKSHFCLQPRGDSFTRRSIFDCMVAGAIPVFFWKQSAYVQYEWFLPGRQEEYSVLVDRRGVRNGSVVIGEVLEGLGEEKVRRMRERLVELIPKLVYALPEEGLSDGKDAFRVAVDGVLNRFRQRREGRLVGN